MAKTFKYKIKFDICENFSKHPLSIKHKKLIINELIDKI